MTKVSIYLLDDPTDISLTMYIGYSKDIEKRYIKHLNEARSNKRTKKAEWIRSLLKRNISPRINILEIVDDIDKKEAEKFYIAYFNSIGAKLCNGTFGGDGVDATMDVRQKIIRSNTGKKRSNSAKDKMRTAKIGKKLTKQHKENISKSLMGQCNPNYGIKFSNEHRTKLSISHIGKQSGENNPFAKFTNEQVNYIRELYAERKVLQREIASMFNVSRQTIIRIINFQRYK